MHTGIVHRIARTELWPLTNRKVPFALMLAVVCTGALFLVGLALSSQSVPNYPGINPLSANRVGAIVFTVWAVTAGLFIVAVILFAVAERRASGAGPVLRLPKTRTLLAWLVLALALLTVLAFMDGEPAHQGQQDQEPAESSQPIGPEELAQPPRRPTTQPRSENRPSVQRTPVASSPRAVYAVVMAMLALAGALAALILGQGRTSPAYAPVAGPEQPGNDQAIDPAWSDEEAARAIQQEPDPRVAVIMCYRLFQSVLEQAEVRVEEHHTPEECGRIAVRSLKLPHRAVSRLVSLYSGARFSEHHIRESHRSAALAEVRRIVVAIREHMAAKAKSIQSAGGAGLKEVPGTVSSGSGRA